MTGQPWQREERHLPVGWLRIEAALLSCNETPGGSAPSSHIPKLKMGLLGVPFLARTEYRIFPDGGLSGMVLRVVVQMGHDVHQRAGDQRPGCHLVEEQAIVEGHHPPEVWDATQPDEEVSTDRPQQPEDTPHRALRASAREVYAIVHQLEGVWPATCNPQPTLVRRWIVWETTECTQLKVSLRTHRGNSTP